VNAILMNSFQTPNSYVDNAMGMLTSEEYKCLSFATRHILGWQDKVSKRRGFISLNMFENGFVSAKGVVFGGTGLTRQTIVRATDELTRLLFLLKIGEPTAEGQEWELGDEPDFAALVERYEARKQLRRWQTTKAREAKREGGLSDIPPATGLLDIPEGVALTDHPQSVQQTDAGLLDRQNQIHVQTHIQTQVQTSAVGADESKSIAEIIHAWLEGSKVIAPNAYANKTIREKAKAMHKLGITPAHITDYIADVRKDAFWAPKGIDFDKVCKEIQPWLDAKRAGWNKPAQAAKSFFPSLNSKTIGG